jgi:sulfatase maturation enzyme AslB (radical SAM superfamily)
MKNCWSTYHELNLTTRGTLSNCCVQDLDVVVDWDKIDDLDEWFRNFSSFNEIRALLNTGVEIKECESCWVQERSDIKSRREYKSDFYKTEKNNITIKKLDLRISNKCNLQCKMCVPNASDQIAKLGKELHQAGITDMIYYQTNDFTQTHTTKILDLAVNLPNLEMITFAGGEPFIMPEVEEFLLKMVNANKLDVRIEFITNCTVIKTDVINLLKNFKNVLISCSIDGIGEQLEYQRYPSKWNIIERNFKKIYDTNFDVVITPCISLLNLTDIHKFVDWANQYPNARVIYNEVDSPEYLNFRYVPMHERQNLINSNTKLVNGDANWDKFFNNLIREYVEPSNEDCNMLKEYSTKVWDYRCNVKFLDMYPWASYMIEKSDE